MKKTKKTMDQSNRGLITRLIVAIWLIVGLYFGWNNWLTVIDLGKFAGEIPKNQDKNIYLFGTDYAVYQLLQSTPVDSRLLYVVPDANNYPARAVYYLYPRNITFVGSFEQALARNPAEYDYLFIYVSIPQYAGYIKGVSAYQNSFWTPQKLIDFNNTIAPTNPLASSNFTEYLSKNYGIFLYERNENNALFTRVKINE